MEMELYTNWLASKAREWGFLLVEKPRAQFAGYRWELRSNSPLRWVGTIELGPSAIMQLAGLPVEERREPLHHLLYQSLLAA
jgi:hypothetical protein